MAQTTDKKYKTVQSIWLIWDHQELRWLGKSTKYGRNSQPAVYWSEGIANSAKPNWLLEDGDPRFEVVSIPLGRNLLI